MKNTEPSKDAVRILSKAYKAWAAASSFRNARNRNKDFTYGRQLEDLTLDSHGNIVTERDAIINSGKEPLTNNLIRQLVKSVVGRYRTLASSSYNNFPQQLKEIYSHDMLDELDARMLEEFLISGCAVQKVETDGLSKNISTANVNFNRFFVNAMSDARSLDCSLVGELHDMSLADIIIRLAPNDHKKAKRIREIYLHETESRICNMQAAIGADNFSNTDFWNATNGKLRVIECWSNEPVETLKCHDYQNGSYFTLPVGEQANIDAENEKRSKLGIPLIKYRWDIHKQWICTWITPMGDILSQYVSPFPHASHPYIIKMYPLTDGEIHAFVEDVIDQQKYVNRLITLVDHIMNASAKGVLLYPTDALPPGFTWLDIKHLWSLPNGIIPYDTSHASQPKQIYANNSNIGAYELLSLEMKLFDNISGVSSALQGRDTTGMTGAKLYERQTENSTIALADIFNTFSSFISQRNAKIMSLVKDQ